jgi:lysophospholipase L1-like esterase
MQAMNGCAVSYRKRGRLIGCCMALVLAFSALVFSASAGAAEPPPPTTYLALGDSLAFGYTQEKFENHFPFNESPLFFEEGYANYLYAKIKGASKKFAQNLKGLHLVNNGCPGETTDSLIGDGSLGKAVDPTGTSPCGYHKSGFELHHEYGGTKSQLESALQVIKQNSMAPGTVKNVTLNIGANDELAAVGKCKAEVKAEGEAYLKSESPVWSKYNSEEKSKPTNPEEFAASTKEAVNVCVSNAASGLFAHIRGNVETILSVLDEGSKYGGVNYTGRIEVLGVYNPFTFLLEGSDLLQALLNGQLKEAAEKFPNAVYTDDFSAVNPQKGGEGNAKEKETICKYTEMCNVKDQEANAKKAEEKATKEKGEGKIFTYPPTCTTGEPSCEGDIHPTVAGAKKMAAFLFKVYTP